MSSKRFKTVSENSPGYQRVVAVKKNSDGTSSKVYAVRRYVPQNQAGPMTDDNGRIMESAYPRYSAGARDPVEFEPENVNSPYCPLPGRASPQQDATLYATPPPQSPRRGENPNECASEQYPFRRQGDASQVSSAACPAPATPVACSLQDTPLARPVADRYGTAGIAQQDWMQSTPQGKQSQWSSSAQDDQCPINFGGAYSGTPLQRVEYFSGEPKMIEINALPQSPGPPMCQMPTNLSCPLKPKEQRPADRSYPEIQVRQGNYPNSVDVCQSPILPAIRAMTPERIPESCPLPQLPQSPQQFFKINDVNLTPANYPSLPPINYSHASQIPLFAPDYASSPNASRRQAILPFSPARNEASSVYYDHAPPGTPRLLPWEEKWLPYMESPRAPAASGYIQLRNLSATAPPGLGSLLDSSVQSGQPVQCPQQSLSSSPVFRTIQAQNETLPNLSQMPIIDPRIIEGADDPRLGILRRQMARYPEMFQGQMGQPANMYQNQMSPQSVIGTGGLGMPGQPDMSCSLNRQRPRLSERDANETLDEMIETTIKGFSKLADTLKGRKPMRCIMDLPDDRDKLNRLLHDSIVQTESNLSNLRKSMQDTLVEMTKIIAKRTNIQMPEMTEMASGLTPLTCPAFPGDENRSEQAQSSGTQSKSATPRRGSESKSESKSEESQNIPIEDLGDEEKTDNVSEEPS